MTRTSPWVRKEISGPGSEGGEKTSTKGSLARSFSAPRTPTRQPIRLMTRSGFFSLSGRSEVRRPIGLVLGGLAHDAGVQHDHVRFFGFIGKGVTEMFQRRADALRVGDVHLAAFGPEVVFFCHRAGIIPM